MLCRFSACGGDLVGDCTIESGCVGGTVGSCSGGADNLPSMGWVHFGSDGMFSGNFGGNILCPQNI